MSHRFDWIVDPAVDSDALAWNTPVRESERFVAVPSKGSLVPGWTLVVPRRPLLNLSGLSDTQKGELNDFCHVLRITLSGLGGQVFEFEHGAQNAGSIMGCGVDQAHLHLVPLSFDLLEAASTDQTVEWRRVPVVNPWCSIPDGSEYLMVRKPETDALVGHVLRPISQWFRKLIATELGMSDCWDYRKDTYLENVLKTLQLFKTS
jgi:ATP adenylyltransferase